jgi:PST family polysaccharide transporter
MYRTIAGAVANVALNVFLIPRYSAVGAAIATVFSQGIAAVLANVVFSRTRPIFWLQLRSFLPNHLWIRPWSIGERVSPPARPAASE